MLLLLFHYHLKVNVEDPVEWKEQHGLPQGWKDMKCQQPKMFPFHNTAPDLVHWQLKL